MCRFNDAAMKKILIGVAVVLLLLVIGITVFIATFDANLYRPLVTAQLSNAIGRPVSMARLSLAWRGGVAAEARGLVIGDAQAPAFRADRASATLQLVPLLRRDVRIGAVVLAHPQVRVSRDAQGRIDMIGLAAVGAPAAAPAQPATVGGVWSPAGRNP